MRWVRESPFGFLVGAIPIVPWNVASFDQARAVVEQVGHYCVKPPPQGKGWGGIQRAGKRPVLRTRHRIKSLWWTLLNPIDRSRSQPGRHSVRARAVRGVYLHTLQFQLAYDSSGDPPYSKTHLKPLKVAEMLVTRRSIYYNIAE